MQEKRANALINEKSPYLLQHAFNPVNWYPWNEEALRRAREEDKPIFLSIGYSTCHWCHVMERESFEDNEIAEIINENFIPIKVDREERPDLDDLYMKAVQALTGQGGWPLNVFLTPDLKPFFGGTYFPPKQRYGLPGFKDILEHIARLWKEKRDEILKGSEQILRSLHEEYAVKQNYPLSIDTLDAAYTSLVASFDPEYGGFGGPPKFPLPTYIYFLLRYYKRKNKEIALRASIKTLECIANGGINDQIGGGFHRYSTDRTWLIPHFEKMLYDNALLAIAYVEAFQLVRKDQFLKVAKRTLDWMLTEMMDRESYAFYSAQDADTSEGEGAYYTWTQPEVNALLGEREGSIFCYHFGITRSGNFENGRSIPYIARSLEDTSSRFEIKPDELDAIIQRGINLLYEARIKRERPSIDYKIITSWNSLAISSLCRFYQVTGERRYIDAAKRTAEFIIGNMLYKDRLLRRYAKGEAGIDGTLEDYAFLTQSFIDLFESTFEARWIELALELNERTINEFWDSEGGAFFFSLSKELPMKIKDGYDGPLPSGNSVAILNLLRLYELTGNEKYREMAEHALKVFNGSIETSPSAHTYMLIALDHLLNGSYQIVIVGEKMDRELNDIFLGINQHFIPSKSLIVVTEDNRERLNQLTPLIEGKHRLNGKPTVYICKGNVCMRPMNSLNEIIESIK